MSGVLDAWALFAFLKDEPAAPRVEAWIARGDTVASWINVGETYYSYARRHGHERARIAIDSLEPAVRFDEPDAALVLAAAQLKADEALSYADAFAVATSWRRDLPLLTGDPEILALEGRVEVVDLRESS